MSNGSSNADWSPGAPPVTIDDFGTRAVLVVHYWAAWNQYDREMDMRLAALRDGYADRVCFRSCDVDRPENQPFIRGIGIGNVPALGCFIAGEWFESLVGLRPDDELRSVLDGWLCGKCMAKRGHS